ncbi:MAG: S41 family peptidase, partial [Candidatus Niyogibacteria bacterium]|nr:S41 family peptidase [Candidatus Niyogibacteria bacterium]
MNTRNKILTIAAGAIVIVAVFSIGVYAGTQRRPAADSITDVENKELGNADLIDFSIFWTTWKTIKEKYVAPGEIDSQDLVWGAIKGMVHAVGDPYTVFLPPKENELFQSSVRGDFEGVGMEIGMRNDVLTVIAPLAGTPAFRAGIKAGDQIIKIGEETSAGISLDEAVSRIRGPKGTEVILTIIRKGEEEPLTISVIRDRIEIPVIETDAREIISEEEKNGDKTASTVGDDIQIIRLFSFSEKSTSAFRDAVRDFALSGRQKIILDLRNNPGGFLEAAVDISSWFLPSGDVVVRESFGENKEEKIYRSRGYETLENKPVVVLINEGSASASEIVAGALQDHDTATLIGTKTFGKGSVQELVNIKQDSALKVTIARWLTPDGHSISENGLEPDITAELEGDDTIDEQLEKAIEFLNNR